MLPANVKMVMEITSIAIVVTKMVAYAIKYEVLMQIGKGEVVLNKFE